MRRTVACAVVLLVGSLAAGCARPEPLELPAAVHQTVAPAPSPAPDPVGTVRVAYPDVPATWTGGDGDDTAATDLAALWSLPLYRYDAQGQLVPGLATEASFPNLDEGWAVDLRLAEGRWSDGRPVTAADVVATVELLREARPEEWAALTGVAALAPDRVRLRFAEPHGRWAHLLAGPPGVLPADLLADEGIGAFEAELPVVGGRFRLQSYDEGRSAVFVAHPHSPLGPPALERVEVLFVPSYETALGLLDAEEVDVVLGHLALNPVARAERLAGVLAAAPLGGTTVALEWLEDGSLGDSAALRRTASAALDLGELVAGLLSDVGEPATSPVPGVPGPLDAALSGGRTPSVSMEGEVVVLVPRWHEALGFTSRAVQRDLASAGAATRLVTVATPELQTPLEPHDGALRIRRDGPRPALGAAGDAVPPAPDEVLAEQLAPTFEELADAAWETPLYRIGVAHAWRPRVSGIEPSSWPGLAFSGVGDWRLEAG